MADRRISPDKVTPSYEDKGIFQGAVGNFAVDLIPKIGQNNRKDLIIHGLLDGTHDIDVVFAGRRARQAKPIVDWLIQNWARANQIRNERLDPPELTDVRCSIRVEGAWRKRLEQDDLGWQTHHHQLFAARWIMDGPSDQLVTFGEAPKTTTQHPK